MCDEGTCLLKVWVCDGVEDCNDGTDEDEAFCATCPFKFLCTNGRCVDLEDVCNGQDQCRDNSDEDQICVGMFFTNMLGSKLLLSDLSNYNLK